MKILCIVTSVLELGAGLALLCFPSAAMTLLAGVPLESPAALTVARIGGAGLLALGIACWMASGDTHNRAAEGLIFAMLVYNIAAAGTIIFAGIGFGLHGVALWPAVALHAVLAVWCAACLRTLKFVISRAANQKRVS